MLAFLGNLGPFELLVVVVLAVLIFGKNLPQAASKAYMQARKLRNAVDDLRRDSGIERELRDIERSVREAEWEARRKESGAWRPASTLPAAPPAAPGSQEPSAETDEGPERAAEPPADPPPSAPAS